MYWLRITEISNMKNLGREEFQKRIDSAVGSFMFEISVIRSQYNMQDPESKTAFYNAAARKLLEFPEKLERDAYTEAVAREYMIPQEDLKRLVYSLGGQYGTGIKASDPERRENPEKRRRTGSAGPSGSSLPGSLRSRSFLIRSKGSSAPRTLRTASIRRQRLWSLRSIKKEI